MKDMCSDVLSALKSEGLNPQYAYPQAWNTAPVIAFWESGNSEEEHADDAELTSVIEITVDIWAETPEETHAKGHLVNRAMQGLGFIRIGCYDLYEGEIGTGLHHRSMTFSQTIPNDD